MATVLQFPAFPAPRHGILLNPSPGSSPYSHGHSLPGTPRLISSVSSLSSSASSNSPNTSDADTYFLTYACAKDTLSGSSSHPREPSTPLEPALSRDNSRKHRPGSAPQTRRIRFAPLPEPRRDDLPEVFLNDSEENIAGYAYDSNPSSRASSRPSSLLLNGVVNLDNAASDITPTLSLTNLNAHDRALGTPSQLPSIHTTAADVDWDMCQPTSPSTTISSLDHFTQSCPTSPLSKRIELPKETSWSAKLLKPFRARSGTSASRDSEEGCSSGTSTPARSGSRERGSEYGVPLARHASDNNIHGHRAALKRSSLSRGDSADDGLWRTQSGPGEMRRVKSREQEMEELRRVRSGSGSGYGPRKQLRMLNGRIYGAKRQHNNVNLFASARSEEPEFVEWGYGGMGSVKTAASVGADNKYSRVAGSSAFGGSEKRGRAATDDDDGSGMTWVRRRREQREREKKEALEKEKEKEAQQPAAAEESHTVEKPHADVADPDPPSAQPDADMPETVKEAAKEKEQENEQEEEKDEVHITQAVAVPAQRSHHRAPTMERAPSISSVAASSTGGHVQLVRTGAPLPERRGSADTARAASPHTLTERAVSQLELEEDAVEGRSGSGSSSNSNTESEEEEGDADTEEGARDEEDEEEEDETTRRTALGAGVEKVSRHNKAN